MGNKTTVLIYKRYQEITLRFSPLQTCPCSADS